MKKFFASVQVRNLSMSLFFLLGMMFIGTGSAKAQASVNGSTTNWYADGVALNILNGQVKALKQGDLVAQQGNPPAYAQAEARYHFYVGIIESINAGMNTEAAFYANLQNITAQPSQNDFGSAAANTNLPIDNKGIMQSTLALLTY